MSIFMESDARHVTCDEFSAAMLFPSRHLSLATCHWSLLERLHRFRLRHFMAALLANPARIIRPEILHGLAEMFDDVAAIEINVLHQCAAVIAVEDHMFVLAGGTTPLDHNADR